MCYSWLHHASPPPLQRVIKEQRFQIVKQFFPTGASGSLARYTAAQELRPGLPHGWACDGQAKLLWLPSCSAPSTHYSGWSTNALASIGKGVLHEHHMNALCWEGCDAGRKMDGCFLPHLICFAYICMLAIAPFTLQLPFAGCRSFASQSWWVCMCVSVCVWREIQESGLCNRTCM